MGSSESFQAWIHKSRNGWRIGGPVLFVVSLMYIIAISVGATEVHQHKSGDTGEFSFALLVIMAIISSGLMVFALIATVFAWRSAGSEPGPAVSGSTHRYRERSDDPSDEEGDWDDDDDDGY